MYWEINDNSYKQGIKDKFRNSMSYAVSHRFDCASKTLDTIYNLSLIWNRGSKIELNFDIFQNPEKNLIFFINV